MLSGQSMPEVLQEALRLANARRRSGGEGPPLSLSPSLSVIHVNS